MSLRIRLALAAVVLAIVVAAATAALIVIIAGWMPPGGWLRLGAATAIAATAVASWPSNLATRSNSR